MKIIRPTMAKDVIKKKQRIAHNKTNECHEMYPEYDDILTSIMQDMDNTNLMPAMCLNNILLPKLLETSKVNFHEKTQSSVHQIPDRSLSSLPKLKKFGLSRKGPLMEKSQRILKQLQHNRKQPKPRAHLAGFNSQSIDNSVSSEKSRTKDHNARVINKFQNKAVTEKQVYNKIAVNGNKMKKSSIEELKSKEMNSRKLKETVMEKRDPINESCHTVKSAKKHESATEKKCSPEKPSEIINTCDKYGNSSDSDEYEKFIQKEKKDLPQKPKKKTSINIKSQNVLNKVSRKRSSKSVSSESESDLSDEESSNSHKSKKMRKPFTNSITNNISKKVSRRCISGAKSNSGPTSDDSEESSNSLNSKKMRKTHDILDNGRSKSSIKNKVFKNVNRKCVTRSEYMSSSSDSEMSDDGQRPSTSYKKRRKVHKKINDGLSDTSKEDCETEMGDVNDGTYHNSSSESDELPSPSEIMHGLPSNSNQSSAQMGNQPKTELSEHSNKTNIPSSRDEPNILCNKKNILQNETSSYEIPNIVSIGSKDQPNVLHESSDMNALVHSANQNILRKTCDHPSLGSVCINTECADRQNNSVSITTGQENSPKSLIIDLVESDNECESSFTVVPKIVMISSQNKNYPESSEESEIELVDVIVPPDPPVSAKRSGKSGGHKNVPFPKNSANELNIKSEKVNETTLSTAKLQSAKSNPESRTPLISKNYEVAYSTGICQKPDEEKESKEKVRKQLSLNCEKSLTEDNILKHNELQNNVISNAKDSLILNKVKKEPCDDLEIILDTASSSNSAINLSNKQLHRSTSIKVEKDSAAVKQTIANPNINADPIDTREKSVEEKAKDLLIPNKKVKKEPAGDECEIILDTASTNISKNLSSVQMHNNRSLKVESDTKGVLSKSKAIHIANDGPIGIRENSSLTEKRERLHENPHSAFTSLTSSHNKMVQPSENELNALSIKFLLENLKKEFETYREIIVTEQSVETTFKLLERCQAERLQSIKTQILQNLESLPSNTDNNSLKIEMHKLLDSSDSLKDTPNVSSACPSDSSSTSDISMKDLKTLATMNLVPLSSISEKDIKPNLSELQYAVKQELSPSYEMNSMSFGEKCIVCRRDASAACQQCAKVFFCSNECGMKYWEDGHKNTCMK